MFPAFLQHTLDTFNLIKIPGTLLPDGSACYHDLFVRELVKWATNKSMQQGQSSYYLMCQ